MLELFPPQNLAARRLLLLSTSLTLGALGWFLLGDSEDAGAQEPEIPRAISTALPTSEVLVEIDGRKITRDRIETRAADELARLEAEKRALLERALEAEIADHLLAREAERRGMTVDQLLGGGSVAEAEARRAALVTELKAKTAISRLTPVAERPNG